ncbi:MAG: hypothetical protein K6U78_09190 [Anaerolineae bacterium]|jgi:hypothetical protein|nr:hypothetical protein [Anaerolineae bacterium]
MNDVVINKVQSIQRCVKRAREEYGWAENFITDYTCWLLRMSFWNQPRSFAAYNSNLKSQASTLLCLGS